MTARVKVVDLIGGHTRHCKTWLAAAMTPDELERGYARCSCDLEERLAAAKVIDASVEELERENERLCTENIWFIGGQSG